MLRTLLLSACTACAVSAAAQTPFNIGETRVLHSAVLGEERTLNIALPPGYNDSDTTRYPVIYLLDGSADEDFIHVVGALQFASFEWVAWQQPSIVVGIATVDRRRDFTFPTTIAADKEAFPTTGGSAAFLRFLSEELIPHVDAGFRTAPDRLLIGQSLGGLLATEVLMTRPELFQRYLIISPSIWWDGGSVLKRPAAFLEKPELAPRKVTVIVGKEGKVMERDAKRVYTLVRSNKAIDARFKYMPLHDHANVMHNAVIDGFRLLGTDRK